MNAYRTVSKGLDRLYAAVHVLACIALATMAGMIVVEVGGRVLDSLLELVGLEPTGFTIPSLAEFTGFLFVAATFLALASTLRHGVHIRVTILLDRVPPAAQRALKCLAGLVGTALFGFAAWYAVELVLDSIRFNEVSFGIVAVPLAIPQSAMAAGLIVFTIAMAHEAIAALVEPDAVRKPTGDLGLAEAEEPATGHGALGPSSPVRDPHPAAERVRSASVAPTPPAYRWSKRR